ncbi:MAG: tetratricopeptide repeat protein [Candidatus Eisenbacteria sp.]|nr:tetratricopeptide repeat protein [Candidatus Eisenbacteria bacterium]
MRIRGGPCRLPIRRFGGAPFRSVSAFPLHLLLALALLTTCAPPPPVLPPPDYPDQMTLYTLQPGETLHDLAERSYGDRSLGWSLAIVNEFPDPGMPEAGTTIYIPNSPEILVSMAQQRGAAKRPYNRGTVLLELGRNREAIRQLEQALSVVPEVVAPRYHLGVAYLREGRVEEAVMELEEVARRRPLDRDFRYALGCAYLEQGTLEAARRQFDQAFRFDNSFAPAQFGLALALHLQGKRRDAAKAWRGYLEMDPTGDWAEQARRRLMSLYEED